MVILMGHEAVHRVCAKAGCGHAMHWCGSYPVPNSKTGEVEWFMAYLCQLDFTIELTGQRAEESDGHSPS